MQAEKKNVSKNGMGRLRYSVDTIPQADINVIEGAIISLVPGLQGKYYPEMCSFLFLMKV